MHVGTAIMGIAILVFFAMPLIFAFMWAQIRLKINDEEKEKEAAKDAVSVFINVEMSALLVFVAGTYLKAMVSFYFAVAAIIVVIAAIFMFNRMLNAPKVEVIINNGGDTA